MSYMVGKYAKMSDMPRSYFKDVPYKTSDYDYVAYHTGTELFEVHESDDKTALKKIVGRIQILGLDRKYKNKEFLVQRINRDNVPSNDKCFFMLIDPPVIRWYQVDMKTGKTGAMHSEKW